MTLPDFVVVGAGLTGVAVADRLTAAGATVTVLEQKRRAASEATRWSGGMVRGWDPDPLTAELAAASLLTYQDPDQWPGGCSPLRVTGAVTVLARDTQPPVSTGPLELVQGERSALGIHLDGAHAVVEPGAGWVAPQHVASQLLGRARAAGAELRTREPVFAVRSQGGRPRLSTGSGELAAGQVVLARGRWESRLVTATSAGHAPVHHRSIQVVLVRRPASAGSHATFIDLRTGVYGKPVTTELSLVGLPHDVWDEDPKRTPGPDHEHTARIIKAAAGLLPWIAEAPIVREIRSGDAYGCYTSTELLVPTGVADVWAVRAWNGAGVKTAPEAARRICTQLIAPTDRKTHLP